MANLFLDNAYNVLGLDTSASQKEITKRSKEIINLLRIQEHSEYETDLGFAAVDRDENGVKEAVQRLSSPTKRIQEYFFWFDIENDTDEKALKLLQAKDIDRAIDLWNSEATKETAAGYVAKKNLGVLTSLLLLEKGQKKYLTQSIGYWKDTVLSEKFWSHFEKLYALNDEIGTSKNALDDFKDKVTDVLSDFYTDVSQKQGDKSFYALFSKIFAVTGQKMQKDVLAPIYAAIHDASQKLKHLNISEDKIISDDEVKELRRLTKVLQTNFDALNELGLYNDSTSKIMRDKAAEAIRTVALDLYNNLNESSKSVALFNIASKIAGTSATIAKINKDIEKLRENRAQEKVIEPINDLLGEEKYSDALDIILPLIPKYIDDKFLSEYLLERLKWCVMAISADSLTANKELFEKEKYTQAAQAFANLQAFTEQYLEYFDNINLEWLNGNVARIEQMTSTVTGSTIESVAATRDQIVNTSNEAFPDKPEHIIVVTMIDCAMYRGLSLKMPGMKRKRAASNAGSRVLGWIIGFIVVAIVGGILSSLGGNSSNSGSGSSSSSGSSAHIACMAEYNSLKSQLATIESEMTTYQNQGNNDAYNNLVPQQNSLVRQVNDKATECNND